MLPIPCPLSLLYLLLLLLSTRPTLSSSLVTLPTTTHLSFTPTPAIIFTIAATTIITTGTGTESGNLPTCILIDGTLTQATEENPVLVIDDVYDDGDKNNNEKKSQILLYACLECFCLDEDYDYFFNDDDEKEEEDGDDGGVVSEALCLAIDCAAPRCVDPVRFEGHCCPVCPHGKNCYLTTKSKKTKKTKCKETPKKKKRKKKNNKNKKNQDKTGKRDKKRKSKTNTGKENIQREIIPAGKSVVRGNRKCRCDDTEPEFATPYNTEAICTPTDTVSKFRHPLSNLYPRTILRTTSKIPFLPNRHRSHIIKCLKRKRNVGPSNYGKNLNIIKS